MEIFIPKVASGSDQYFFLAQATPEIIHLRSS